MPINPFELSTNVTEAYTRYIRTAFYLKDPSLRSAFFAALGGPERHAKGPYLEMTPPFKLGKSLSALISEGVLSKAWLKIESQAFHLDRPLYWHQEQAIRKVTQGRNLIVATGTGSGKTEAFLYPIIDSLLREWEESGRLAPGVRALLLYPMNALVNDQLKRLRFLLRDVPFMTFGRYTGETPESLAEAIDGLGDMPRIPNELIARDEMRKTPPHLLVTNYAMLEYLLQRPVDTELFDGQYSRDWRFMVLDEAHTYTGASGTEVGMLLRRVKQRVGQEHIQAIATSATLGGGEKDYPQILQFAHNLFSEPFEWDSGTQTGDIVGASRVSVDEMMRPDIQRSGCWYEQVADAISARDQRDLVALGVLKPADSLTEETISLGLYRSLAQDESLYRLLKQLTVPQELTALAGTMSADLSLTPRQLVAMVDLAVKARPSPEAQALLPARYHLMIRAIEGAFVSLWPRPAMMMNRHNEIAVEGRTVPVYELGVCLSCGGAYVIGHRLKGALSPIIPRGAAQTFLGFGWHDNVQEDPDDEVSQGSGGVLSLSREFLCSACGLLAQHPDLDDICPTLEHSHDWQAVTEAPVLPSGGTRCVHCGTSSGAVSRVIIGQDAAPAVIATALYGELQSKSRETDEDIAKLLVFADSRQDAAFFAPYLDSSYNRLVWRRIIRMCLDADGANQFWMDDLAIRVQRQAQLHGLLNDDQSLSTQTALVWTVLIHELMNSGVSALNRVGQMAIEPVTPPKFVPPALPHWQGSEQQTWALLATMWNHFRLHGALSVPEGVRPQDLFVFDARDMRAFRKTDGAGAVLSWLPKEGFPNARTDYLKRLGEHLDWPPGKADAWARELLEAIWNVFVDPSSPWKTLVEQRSIKGHGVAFMANYRKWRMVRSDSSNTFQCNTCRKMYSYALYNVCPSWHCTGTLKPASPESLQENHYYYLYDYMPLVGMVAREHTAQLVQAEAQRLQQQFMQGEVTVLSCSTTFELGVDAGELEAVFMRNMPPEAANYVQRAGRAGRRTSSAAIAVTFAQRRAHDIAQFNDPHVYLEGKVPAPTIVLDNEKIVRRHLHAVVMSWYFHRHPESFGNVSSFFPENEWTRETNRMQEDIATHKQELGRILANVVPAELRGELGVDDQGWLVPLFGPKGVLTMAIQDLQDTVEHLRQLILERVRSGKTSDSLTRLINTFTNQPLLSFLSNHNILPKYGFPIDVVELKILDSSSDANRVTLQRDLRLAIGEYAPGSSVVAAGKVWTSRGLRRVKGQEWPWRTYSLCSHCGRFQLSPVADVTNQYLCQSCHDVLSRPRTMMVPLFGFVTQQQDASTAAGEHRPARGYTSQVYFTEFSDQDQRQSGHHDFANGMQVDYDYARYGKFAVINSGKFGRGYSVCKVCGYGREYDADKKKGAKPLKHKSPWGGDCDGFMQVVDLGHEFSTDLLKITFPGSSYSQEFWQSLLYAIGEGAISALSIARKDLGATLYYDQGMAGQPSLVLYDDVPGGAGIVRRIKDALPVVLNEARERVAGQCGCGAETSCYGCLRTYSNQLFHDQLKRGLAYDFLDKLLNSQTLSAQA